MSAVLLPLLAVLAVAFCRVVTLPVWKSVSIFLAVCGVWSSLSCLTVVANAVLSPGSKNTPWLCFAAGWIQMALVWYPATHAVRRLLREEAIVRTWYVFWILPVVFLFFNLLILPEQGEDLLNGRLLSIYLVLALLTLGLLHLFYLLFYLMAQELNTNVSLRRENQFLQMQTAQYETLRSAIDETRRRAEPVRKSSGGRRVHRLLLHGSGNAGIGVQGEPGAVAAQHGGEGFHVHPVLQGQHGKCVPLWHNKGTSETFVVQWVD